MGIELTVAIVTAIGVIFGASFSVVSIIISKKMDRKDKKLENRTAYEVEVMELLLKIKEGLVVTLYDRIKYLGLRYISEGEITSAELNDYRKMYKKAKALDVNGFLDDINNRVDKLPLNEDKPKRQYHIDCPLLDKK